MNILFVGNLWKGATGPQRVNALKALGYHVDLIDTFEAYKNARNLIIFRILNKLGYPPDLANINEKIIRFIKNNHVNILWIDKRLELKPSTLKIVKKHIDIIKLIFFSPDDMMNPGNQSRYWKTSLDMYDLHITTKSYNVEELLRLGARNVHYIPNAYDPLIHRPIILSEEEIDKLSCDVGFVGDMRKKGISLCAKLQIVG